MAYLQNFSHDVFVSYSLANDELQLEGQPWVSTFVSKLKAALRNLLPENGKDVEFYFAGHGSLGYGQQLESCRDEAQRAAVFLIIGSPRYLDAWPTSELRSFTETGAKLDRFFVAELLPLGANMTYPPVIGDPLRAQFWRWTRRGAPQHYDQAIGEFGVILAEFADAIAKRLIALREAPAASTSKRSSSQNRRPVLLARVPDHLEPLSDKLRTHLGQYDIPVLPTQGFLEEGEAFQAEFRGFLHQADIVVQLLGEAPGRKSRTMPHGYDIFQAETARAERPECALLQWRPLSIDLNSVTDPAHRDLISGANAMDFEPFKDMVVRAATALPERPSPNRDGTADGKADKPAIVLFIDAAKADEDTARLILQECRRRNIIAVMPDYKNDRPKDWRENYAESDCIAVVHANSEPAWLNAQLKLFIRVAARRRAKRQCVIWLGPPPPKDEKDLTVVHPDFTIVESMDGDLGALFEELF